MEAVSLCIEDVVLFRPSRVEDGRGFLSETFRASALAEALGREVGFVQENDLFSKDARTVRGFHYQSPPHAQGKLVRVMCGAILDFALDIRRGSSTFGMFAQAEISAENGHQLWLPEGFAHGFITLQPNTRVLVKLSAYYHAPSQGVIAWDDADLAVPWPLDGEEAILSERDRAGAPFGNFASPFSAP